MGKINMVISMFNNYKIEDNVLYLYVNDKYEIGSFFNNDNNSLINKVKDYIKKMKIKFDGTKVVLILSGLLLGTIYLNQGIESKTYEVYKGDKYVHNLVFNNEEKYSILDEKVNTSINEVIDSAINNVTDKKTEIKKENIINNTKEPSGNINKTEKALNSNIKNENTNNNLTVKEDNKVPAIENKEENKTTITENKRIITVHKSNGEVINIDLEEYLIGVVAAEMPASFNKEALKAQAVASRTYTMKLLSQNKTITDDVSTQMYKTNDELKNVWGSSYDTYYSKVKSAVLETMGVYLTYNGEIIEAIYHSTSNGYTEDSINVWGNSFPYLKTVTSPWDTSASSFLRQTSITYLDISNKLGLIFNYDTFIEIVSKDESNRILKIKIDNKEYTGVQIRNLLGLRSADFDIQKTDEGIIFTTRGYGHGVGMSQYGANGMANSGYSYDAILKHYYTGISIVK